MNARVHEYAVVRANVSIGSNVVIHPHVVIEDEVRIGDGVEIFPGSYLGKRPAGARATARATEFVPGVDIGEGCSIGPHAVLFQDVEVGAGSLVGDGASLREGVRVGKESLVSRHVTVNYNTLIGDRAKVMDLTHLTGNCRVGNDAFVSALVVTVNDNNLGRTGYEESSMVGPTICDGAGIGAGAILLPAIVVGEHAIVASGAVVTKDVAPYDVVMGVPARVVRAVR